MEGKPEIGRRLQPQRRLHHPSASPRCPLRLPFFLHRCGRSIYQMFLRFSFALLLIPLTALPASAAQPRATKCKVQKRQQGVFNVSPTSTSPATDLPTLASSTAMLPSSTPSPTPTILPPFDYSKEKVRGVNLGGWFMMEVSGRRLIDN